jgi:acyl dehydratase
MTLDARVVGRTYGPFTYDVGAEKMRDFACAVAGAVPGMGGFRAPPGLSPLLFDQKAAEAGPYSGLIGAPTFPMVCAMPAFAAAMEDPELGADLSRFVAGGMEMEVFGVIRPGDRLLTTSRIEAVEQTPAIGMVVVTMETRDASDALRMRCSFTGVVNKE